MAAVSELHCDTCDATFRTSAEAFWVLRLRAETEHGWHCDPDGDTCPACIRALFPTLETTP